MLLLIAVQQHWKGNSADVTAAFLQGQPLDRGTPLFFKVPKNWPDPVMERLRNKLGAGVRHDVMKITKGLFGLGESPRLWYLAFRQVLLDLGFCELKLAVSVFVYFGKEGQLQGLVSVHVDDALMAGSSHMTDTWSQLQARLKLGSWKALDEGVTYVGRHMQRNPADFTVRVDMDGFCSEVKPMQVTARDWATPLSESEKVDLARLNGQLAWAARQGRPDLSYGVSRCQQGQAEATIETAREANAVTKRAHVKWFMVMPDLKCELSEVIFLAATDAAHGAMPRLGSQLGSAVRVI